MEDILRRGPAACAFWRILEGFLRLHSEEECLHILDDYAGRGGGDV